MLNDIRFAFRTLRQTPLFTSAVVLTVALAIAANSTMFSVVNAVLLKPLPFREPGRIVQVAEKNDKLNLPSFGSSVLNFLSWREQTKTFEELAAIGSSNYTLTGSGEPEQLSGNRISPALPRVLGIAPVAGRAFTDDEEKPGGASVVMIGEGLWKRRFGGDLSLVGRTIILNDAPATVVGIAPAALNLISGGDVYTPLTIDPAKEIRLNHQIFTVGRLKPGVSIARAQAEMDAISTHLGQQYPEIRDWGIRLISLFDTFVSPQLKTGLLVLMWAVAFVLLIACANIANLLLARAAARQNEMAVRTSVGASWTQLLRQLLVESLMLSITGGVAGLLVAMWALRAINHTLPANTLPIPSIEMDATVLWYALALTLVTGLLFGIAPAWRTARVDLNAVLQHGGRGSAMRMSARLRNGLAAAELALATVLVICAGLFLQSLANLGKVHVGFSAQGLITFQLAPPTAKYPLNGKAQQFYRSLQDSLQSLPGVRGAAVSSGIPFGAGNYTTHPMLTTEQSELPPNTAVPIDWRIASPGYFKTMGIPLLRGRDFTDADGPAPAPPVMIISQAAAKKFWGDADPLGHTLRRSADPRTAFTIVGVVGDVRNTALTQESPALYYPLAWRVWPLMDIVVRTDRSPEALLPALRQRVHELDAELALANVRTMEDWLSNSAAQPRLNTTLLSVFAFVALLIASIGIYGVLAYSVSQRTREIGVRMALGAPPLGVLRLFVGEGMKVALIGIGSGMLGGLALGRTVSSLVFGVPVRDPITFLLVSFALGSVALAACAIPALRASRVDPIVALRYE
ncbi:MAG TPA: ABC transporter permease [Candidatus Acidoferrum sp.]|nr:ABC transporter permease [Candidatus Acidoferrum sp.]